MVGDVRHPGVFVTDRGETVDPSETLEPAVVEGLPVAVSPETVERPVRVADSGLQAGTLETISPDSGEDGGIFFAVPVRCKENGKIVGIDGPDLREDYIHLRGLNGFIGVKVRVEMIQLSAVGFQLDTE